MKKSRFAIISACAMLLSATACFTPKAFLVPELGVHVDQSKVEKYLVYDEYAKDQVIDIARFKEINYSDFVLSVPEKLNYFVPVHSNAAGNASWTLKLSKRSTECYLRAVYSQMPINVNSLDELEEYFKSRHKKASGVIRSSTSRDKFGSEKIFRYEVTAREKEDGRLIVANGFCMADPVNRGFYYEVMGERYAYERDIDDEEMIVGIGVFMDCFRPTPRVRSKSQMY